MKRINIGCGQTPADGWVNIDNSLILKIAKIPLLCELLMKFNILKEDNMKFAKFMRVKDIRYGNATKKLPFKDNSIDIIYSSHMIEHLDRNEVNFFLNEVLRVLKKDGLIRLVVPDLKKLIEAYTIENDADKFMKSTGLGIPEKPRTIVERIKYLLIGNRKHHWMYDDKSLSNLLESAGYRDVQILPPGKTNIYDPSGLNLREREEVSIYIEARK